MEGKKENNERESLPRQVNSLAVVLRNRKHLHSSPKISYLVEYNAIELTCLLVFIERNGKKNETRWNTTTSARITPLYELR